MCARACVCMIDPLCGRGTPFLTSWSRPSHWQSQGRSHRPSGAGLPSAQAGDSAPTPPPRTCPVPPRVPMSHGPSQAAAARVDMSPGLCSFPGDPRLRLCPKGPAEAETEALQQADPGRSLAHSGDGAHRCHVQPRVCGEAPAGVRSEIAKLLSAVMLRADPSGVGMGRCSSTDVHAHRRAFWETWAC